MISPSNGWGGSAAGRSHLPGGDRALSRRQARRWSQRFAGVGVTVAPGRLREIAAGAPAADDELADLRFALAANEIMREDRVAKLKRIQRRGVRWLLVAGLVLLALNFLWSVAYVLLSLTEHATAL